MQIIKALPEYLNPIMDIYDTAKKIMINNGNKNQWLNGYPSRELIQENINEGFIFCCIKNKEIVGVFYYRIGADPTYSNIYQGTWLNDEPYGVIHRLASNGKAKGITTTCLNWCFQQCSNIRIDTHRDNLIMQNVLRKNNFIYCGIIHLDDGSERLAFQKEVLD